MYIHKVLELGNNEVKIHQYHILCRRLWVLGESEEKLYKRMIFDKYGKEGSIGSREVVTNLRAVIFRKG